uniref:C2H2-type domain-containing protein n=1 Tax=Panagrolaimus sp. JU765 TaxID=591449 RepID=A0AC34RFE4_9BILA
MLMTHDLAFRSVKTWIFTCSICKKMEIDLNVHLKHIRTDHVPNLRGPYSLKCPFCPTTGRYPYYVRHLRQEHKFR